MSYTAADITELDDVAHTRLRPAVNLGQDVRNTALRELVDNAVEEVSVPSHGGSTVTIVLQADSSVTVSDDGRGLPVDSDPVTGKNGIVKTLGTARAGGKFSAHTDAAATGAGLNGIGAAAAVFISARTDVHVRRGGKTYTQCFGRGYPGAFAGPAFDPEADFIRDDTQKLRGVANRAPGDHGTSVRILFDPQVAPDSVIDIGEVLLRAHAAAQAHGQPLHGQHLQDAPAALQDVLEPEDPVAAVVLAGAHGLGRRAHEDARLLQRGALELASAQALGIVGVAEAGGHADAVAGDLVLEGEGPDALAHLLGQLRDQLAALLLMRKHGAEVPDPAAYLGFALDHHDRDATPAQVDQQVGQPLHVAAAGAGRRLVDQQRAGAGIEKRSSQA